MYASSFTIEVKTQCTRLGTSDRSLDGVRELLYSFDIFVDAKSAYVQASAVVYGGYTQSTLESYPPFCAPQ